ncbi:MULTISPECIES: DUF6538 domain-containing protein [Hyphomonas]|uniref:DUF6538 domain-containing protein n=1 Tax=Hyphomonas TaxID=85 RepID=UPI0006744125
MSVFKRGGKYQMRRRVPRRYRGIEPRDIIWISLHTDSESIARSKADLAWAQLGFLERGWPKGRGRQGRAASAAYSQEEG